jgi:hypothetical protein
MHLKKIQALKFVVGADGAVMDTFFRDWITTQIQNKMENVESISNFKPRKLDFKIEVIYFWNL